MPELPDLLYIREYLQDRVSGRRVRAVQVRKPVVLRLAVQQPLRDLLNGASIRTVDVHGPFLRFRFDPPLDMVVNMMVAGRIQHQLPGEKAEGHLCFSLELDDGSRLNICDQELMAKVYFVPAGEYGTIPKYEQQGIDILSKELTLEQFIALATRHRRKQVRAFVNNHAILSAIGNAYSDEILFEAHIHPKTFVGRLTTGDLGTLFHSIRTVIRRGIEEVQKAGQPIHVKVRDHMRVRNRKGEPCPRCGTTIRREGVRGHDVFFCPSCQPATRKHFLDWTAISRQSI